MKGSQADISEICEFGWYDWIMLNDSPTTFQDDKEILGRYLGPAPDIGSALTDKLLKPNGEVICRSNFRQLTPEEIQSPVHQELRKKIMSLLQSYWGQQPLLMTFLHMT